MAQSGFTPISLYLSTTAAAVPTSGNLVAGELALNTVDEKLYFKNSAGTVKLLASNAATTQVYPGAGIGVSTGTAWTTSKATPTGVIVGDTDTQTLTNKTLTAPTIASANLTTALTLAGAAGTSGQVLTSAGSGLPTWSAVTAPGNFGTDLSFVDYTLTVSSALSSSATEILLRIRLQAVSLDGTSELLIIQGTSSAHAVIYNTSTATFGTPILVRTANIGSVQNIGLAKISSTAVLVCSLADTDTALETVVLTVSGSTITVNTALATTLAATSNLVAANTRLVIVGSSYVLNYFTSADSLPKFRAITVSGSTPSIGAELAYAGGTANHHAYSHSASILLHFSASSTTLYALPITVSGTTLTAGTQATATTDVTTFVSGALSSSRYALFFRNTTGRGAVVSVAGSVASISTAATTVTVSSFVPAMQVFSNQAFVKTGTGNNENINVITDTAGIATVGTAVQSNFTVFVGFLSTGKVFASSSTANTTTYLQFGISSGSPVLEKAFFTDLYSSSGSVGSAPYTFPLSGLPQSGTYSSGLGAALVPILRTSAGKLALATTALSFVSSIDGTSPAKLQQAANPFLSFNDGISDAVAWGLVSMQSATSTTVQIRKVTLV